MRSKPVSDSSRASGDVPDPVGAAGREKPEKRERGAGTTEIELEVSRQRSITWVILGLILGALLVWKLGTVAMWVGVFLIATGLYHTWRLVQTLLHPPGTIVVSENQVSLPRGLCLPRPVVANRQDVTAVYFLRRSVPWNHAAPVLVIELGARAMAFPRDWFASEADQRHVIHALLRDKGLGADAESA